MAESRTPSPAARPRWMWLVVLAVATGVGASQAARAQDPAPDPTPPATENADVDLTDLSLEELMDVSIEVTSVSRKKQEQSATAAAIHVITAEDIRRSGLHSVPELLRLVPGLHVARVNGSAWAISARGFNGRFNANLLVIIDGRSVYTPLFSGVYWDVQDLLIEDIDRIEVILGPGAAAWGANAVNGVINVITKNAAETQGALVSLLAGNEERSILGVRYGAPMEDGHWRAYAKSSDHDALITPDHDAAHDERDQERAGFRMDWAPREGDGLTLQGDLYEGDADQSFDIPSLASPPFTTVLDHEEMSGGNLLLRWTRELGVDDDLVVQGYYDRTARENVLLDERRDTFDMEAQRHHRLSDVHDLVFGGNVRVSRSLADGAPGTEFDPDDRVTTLAGVFAEDEMTLVPQRLKLTAGTRLEYHTFSGVELEPNVRLAWTPDDDHTLWAAVSRAVRVPSQADHDALVNVQVLQDFPPGFDSVFTLVGNGEVDAESLIAWEAGWRARLTDVLWVDVAAFYNDYDDAIVTKTGAPVPLSPSQLMFPIQSVNAGDDIARGAEIAATWEPDPDWQLRASWSWLDVHTGLDDTSDADPLSDVAEGSAPDHQTQLRSHHRLGEQWDLDVALFHVDELPALDVASYWRGDLRLGYRPDDATEWSLGVQNIFHRGELEWDGEFLGAESAPENAVYLQYTRRF